MHFIDINFVTSWLLSTLCDCSFFCVIAFILCVIAFILCMIAFIFMGLPHFMVMVPLHFIFKVIIWSSFAYNDHFCHVGPRFSSGSILCPFLDGGVISYLHGSCYLSKKGPASVSYRSPRVRGRHVIVAFLINISMSLCKVEGTQLSAKDTRMVSGCNFTWYWSVS